MLRENQKKAIVISTNRQVVVYRLKNQSGKWCDYSDCKTVYSENELKFV